jgi:hypothetical protein
MPNWCANRIQFTLPVSLMADVESWANGTTFPLHKQAIQQSIRLFLAGVAGRLMPAVEMHYEPYPGLTAHGAAEQTRASLAYGEWLMLLQNNACLDAETCELIDRCYHECNMGELKWSDLTEEEQSAIRDILYRKRMDWDVLVSDIVLFDALASEPDGEVFDLRAIEPTRLACEINGFNGGLLDGVDSAYHFYTHHYGTKWVYGGSPEISGHEGHIIIDLDTAWSPPSDNVIAALSEFWDCIVDHYFSEVGCDFCGYRQYVRGELFDFIDDSLEFGDEDEEGYCDVIGPDWLIGNVAHYGG